MDYKVSALTKRVHSLLKCLMGRKGKQKTQDNIFGSVTKATLVYLLPHENTSWHKGKLTSHEHLREMFLIPICVDIDSPWGE